MLLLDVSCDRTRGGVAVKEVQKTNDKLVEFDGDLGDAGGAYGDFPGVGVNLMLKGDGCWGEPHRASESNPLEYGIGY